MTINTPVFRCWCKDAEAFLPAFDVAMRQPVPVLFWDRTYSKYCATFLDDGTIDASIRWGLGKTPKYFSAPDALSDLFHEIGHSRQDPITVEQAKALRGTLEELHREEDAWDCGWQLLVNEWDNLPDEMRDAFQRRREIKLQTYRDRLKAKGLL
jgi:hypothetical protein